MSTINGMSRTEYYNLVNRLVDDYIQKNYERYMIDDVDKIMECCPTVNSEGLAPIESNRCSVKFSINDSIKLIGEFFREIDPSLEESFINIVYQTDEFNRPVVNFINGDRTYYEKHPDEVTEDTEDKIRFRSCNDSERCYINIKNDLRDIFVIIHEVLHHMGNAIINYADEDRLDTTKTSYVYSETVSIMAEKFLGQYLYMKGSININDYYLIMNSRLSTSRAYAYSVLLQCIYIKMRQDGVEINDENFLEYGLNKLDSKYHSMIRTLSRMDDNSIGALTKSMANGSLSLPHEQKYVRAAAITRNVNYNDEGITIFKELNDIVGNINEVLPSYSENGIKKIKELGELIRKENPNSIY